MISHVWNSDQDDDLESVASIYGVSVGRIKSFNPVIDYYKFQDGDIVNIPTPEDDPAGFTSNDIKPTVISCKAQSDQKSDDPIRNWDLVIACEHDFEKMKRRACRPGTYEVVPQPPAVFDSATPSEPLSQKLTLKDIITLEEKDTLTVYYRDDEIPPPAELKIKDQSGRTVNLKQKSTDGKYSVYAGDVHFDPDACEKKLHKLDFLQMLGASHYKNTFSFINFPRNSPKIDVYCPYEWEVSITLPPFASCKQGTKLQNAVSKEEAAKSKVQGPGKLIGAKLNTTTIETKSWGKTSKEFERTYSSKSYHYESNKSISEEGGFFGECAEGFSVKCNGVSVNPGKTVKALVKIVKTSKDVFEIIKILQDTVPKVGWYADIALALFEGKFTIKWGRKEFKDYQTFSWIYGEIECVLAKSSLEIGVGVKCCFAMQLYVNMSVEISLKLEGGVAGPDTGKIKVPFTRKENLKVGLRIEAGKIANIDANVETGFTGEIALTITFNKESALWEIGGELTWTGIKANLIVDMGAGAWGVKYEPHLVVLSEKKLLDLKFPENDTYESPFLTEEEIIAKVAEEFDKCDLRVNAVGEDLENKTVARIIVRNSLINKPIKRDQKNIEGLAKMIRKDLVERYSNKTAWWAFGAPDYRVDVDRLIEYQKELKAKLPDYYDHLHEFGRGKNNGI